MVYTISFGNEYMENEAYLNSLLLHKDRLMIDLDFAHHVLREIYQEKFIQLTRSSLSYMT